MNLTAKLFSCPCTKPDLRTHKHRQTVQAISFISCVTLYRAGITVLKFETRKQGVLRNSVYNYVQ